MRLLILTALLTSYAYGQCGAGGHLIINPITGKADCTGNAGVGSGTVTSVGAVGTANQITVTGSSPITSAGSWTFSIPTNPTLPGNTTGTFIGNLTGSASKLGSGSYIPILASGTPSAAIATDIVSLFSTCSGTQYLGADGACHTNTAAAGGSTTQLQYNNAGALGGTTGLTWNGTQLTMPDGAIGAASLNWTHTGGGTLGFYKFSNTELGFPDQSIRFIDSGDTRRFLRTSSGNWDVSQTIHAAFDLSFYNASGPGSGNIVALLSDTNLLFGPFSGGALNTGIVRDDADGILNISNAGLTLQPVKFATQSPGDNTTKGATTAFVTAAVAAGSACATCVTSAASLTSTAIVTGAGSQGSQTPSATTTLDTSGNISTPGSVTTGAGGSVGGYSAYGQGTATTAPTSSVGWMAPAAVSTKYMMKLPAAPLTGFLYNTGTSDPSTVSFVANIPVGNLNSGTGATSSTFWRGDGTWATPAGGSGGTYALSYFTTEATNNASWTTSLSGWIPVVGFYSGAVLTGGTESLIQSALPQTGHLIGMTVMTANSAQPGGGCDLLLTYRKNSTSTAATVTVAGGSAAHSVFTWTGSVAVTQGDLVDLQGDNGVCTGTQVQSVITTYTY